MSQIFIISKFVSYIKKRMPTMYEMEKVNSNLQKKFYMLQFIKENNMPRLKCS